MLQQGIQLLERFPQDDRIRVRQPRKNLQIKFTRSLPKGNDFVAYISAIGHLDGTRFLLEWKTTSNRYPEEPQGLLMLDPQLVCYSWITGISEGRPGRVRPEAAGRDPVLPYHHHRRATRGIRSAGRRHHPPN